MEVYLPENNSDKNETERDPSLSVTQLINTYKNRSRKAAVMDFNHQLPAPSPAAKFTV
jgi:hypothetical protein